MKLPALSSVVRVVAEAGVFQLLRPGALVVLTVKGEAVKGNSQKRLCTDAAFPAAKELQAHCDGVQVLHLMANRELERTIIGFCKKRK
mmetsp:Transcript_7703/g.21611  ORF Transcript_7703/g.21611 Transcript_7703/m.21611 type:complete len:88 (-) Transcript_7703:17-280(-)